MKRKIFLLIFAITLILVSCANDTVTINDTTDFISEDVPQTDELTTAETDAVTENDTTIVFTPKRISFLAAGDNIIYYGTVRDAQSMAVSGGRKYNFKPIYKK